MVSEAGGEESGRPLTGDRISNAVTDRRALLLFAALAILTAFYPAFFGELPVPAGGARLLLPDPSPPPDRNDELADVSAQYLPWTTAVVEAYRAGRLPLRFSANGCGTPLWANPQAQVLTPTTLFAVILGPAWGFGAAAAVKFWLAAAGAFLFVRRRGLSRAASTWAALAFGFSLQMTAWMHFPLTWPLSLLPLTLLALDKVARGERGGFAATVAVVALLLFGGYPEGEFFVALCGVAFFFVLLGSRPDPPGQGLRRLGLAAAAALLGLGVTAVFTLPAAIAIGRSERSVQVARGTHRLRPTLVARDFLQPPIYWDIARFWVVPEARGNPRDEDKFGPYSFAGRASGYAGILVLAFALATYFRRGAPRTVRLARWGVVAAALYLLWYPPLVFLLQATPGLSQLSTRLTSNRANGILVLLLAVLAASELQRIRAGGRTTATRAALAILVFATALVFREYALTPQRPPLTVWRAMSFALPALLLVGCFALLTGRLTERRRRVLVVFLLAGTAVDLLRIGARFSPGTRREDWFPATPKMRELQQASRGGRFAAASGALSGMAAMYGLEDVRVHDPMAPADYEDVLGAAAGYTGPAEFGARVTNLDAPILDFLNTRARLRPDSAISSRPAPEAVFPDRLLGAADPGMLLDRLGAETDFLSRAHVVGPGEEFSGSARILAYSRPRPEEVRVRVSTDSPRVLVIPETTDGGWTAQGNGAALPTLTANAAFLAVRVPAGETEIVCRYTPPGLRAGTAISAASAGLLALLALAAFRRGGRWSWRNTGAKAAPRGEPGTGPANPRRDGAASASAARR